MKKSLGSIHSIHALFQLKRLLLTVQFPGNGAFRFIDSPYVYIITFSTMHHVHMWSPVLISPLCCIFLLSFTELLSCIAADSYYFEVSAVSIFTMLW